MQTADSVLDTKRRLEYGVHQIIAEVDKQMKAGSTEINQGINERYFAKLFCSEKLGFHFFGETLKIFK